VVMIIPDHRERVHLSLQ